MSSEGKSFKLFPSFLSLLACFLASFSLTDSLASKTSDPFLSKQWVDPPALPTGEEKEEDERDKGSQGGHRPRRGGRRGGGRRRRSLRAAFSRLFGWLVTVVTIPDAVLLESAGLDALVLTWCFKLGMQVRESSVSSSFLKIIFLSSSQTLMLTFFFQNF